MCKWSSHAVLLTSADLQRASAFLTAMTQRAPIITQANGDDRPDQRPRNAAEGLNSRRTSTSYSELLLRGLQKRSGLSVLGDEPRYIARVLHLPRSGSFFFYSFLVALPSPRNSPSASSFFFLPFVSSILWVLDYTHTLPSSHHGEDIQQRRRCVARQG